MILYIDACVRDNSRTRMLAEHLLLHFQGKEVQHVFLPSLNIPAPSSELLLLREKSQKNHQFTDPYFSFAKQFMEAETVIIAAPYWDLSFPSFLKCWIEAICVSGLTFSYGNDNLPHSHCALKSMYYLTTSGGPFVNHDYGYGYIRCVMENFFGASRCHCFTAEHLDEYGSNPEMILKKTMQDIDTYFRQ